VYSRVQPCTAVYSGERDRLHSPPLAASIGPCPPGALRRRGRCAVDAPPPLLRAPYPYSIDRYIYIYTYIYISADGPRWPCGAPRRGIVAALAPPPRTPFTWYIRFTPLYPYTSSARKRPLSLLYITRCQECQVVGEFGRPPYIGQTPPQLHKTNRRQRLWGNSRAPQYNSVYIILTRRYYRRQRCRDGIDC